MQESSEYPHRQFGSSKQLVSAVGFGAWAIGSQWGKVDKSDAKAALHTALDEGVSCIDTADIYGAGRSESIIGEVLQERSRPAREQLFIASKLGQAEGFEPNEQGVERAIVGSLKRLGLERLDLMQAHSLPLNLLQNSALIDGLRSAKDKGLIAHWGVSIEKLHEGKWLIENTDVDSIQLIFNVMRQQVAHDLLPLAQDSAVAIIARVPLASGLLTGKFQPGHQFDPEDHRHFNADGQAFHVGETFSGLPFERGIELAEQFAQLTAKELRGASLAQKALRWILDHDAVTTVIPGARNANQARMNAAAAWMDSMSEQLHIELAEWYEDEVAASVRGEI